MLFRSNTPPTESWFDATNWSLGTEPGATNDVVVNNGNTTTIDNPDISATASNVFISNDSTVRIGDTITGTLVVEDTISVGTDNTGGTLELNGGELHFNTLIIGTSGTYTDTNRFTIVLIGDAPTIRVAVDKAVTIESEITGTDGLVADGLEIGRAHV